MKRTVGIFATLGIAALCTGLVLSGTFSTASASENPKRASTARPAAGLTKQQALAGRAAASSKGQIPASGPVTAASKAATVGQPASGLSDTNVSHGSLGDDDTTIERFLVAARSDGDDESLRGTMPPGCGVQTLQQMTDDIIEAGVGCAGTINFYARCYDLALPPTAGQAVTVNCVDFAFFNNAATTDYTVTVRLLADSNGCPAGPAANLTLVPGGTTTVLIPGGAIAQLFTGTFPVPVVVPANTKLVVEIERPITTVDGSGIAGANDNGQTAPSYFHGCGIAEYTDYAAIGFATNHLIQRLNYALPAGTLGACCDDISQNCVSNVDIANCLNPNQRFHANQTCAQINPTCGDQSQSDACFSREIACGSTTNGNNEDAPLVDAVVVFGDPAYEFGVESRSQEWYKFVATFTSARVRTCGTDGRPNPALHTIVSVFQANPISPCTTDAQCGGAPANHCINGFCNVCVDADNDGEPDDLLELTGGSSSSACGDCGLHGSVCVGAGADPLVVGRTYYVLVGRIQGSAAGDYQLTLTCPCSAAPSGACCLGVENDCVNITDPPFTGGAFDCVNGQGGSWMGDGTTCAGVGASCVDSPDNCGTAGVLDCGESVVVDNTCFGTAVNDPEFSCAPADITIKEGAGSAFYYFTTPAGATSARFFTSGADTMIAVYASSNACGLVTELGCDNDGGTTGASDLCLATLLENTTYVIQVASLVDNTRGIFTVGVECPGPCAPCADLTCPAGSVQDNDTACNVGGVGNNNDGCADDPASELFQDIDCNDTVCGQGAADSAATPATRDTDWYRFTLTETSVVTVDQATQFSAITLILLILDCDTQFQAGATINTSCNTPGSETVVLPAGDWHIVVAANFTAENCGNNNDYVMSLTCTPVVAGCCTGVSACANTTESACAGVWYGVDATDAPITCQSAPTRCATGACCGPTEPCQQAMSEAECETGTGFCCDVNALRDGTGTFGNCGNNPGGCCYGDEDGNGTVNAGDRGFISANIGQTANDLLCLFDMDGNGTINAGDRGFVSAQIGQPCQPLPDWMDGTCLNHGVPDTRFGPGGPPLVDDGEFQGFGALCADCPCIVEPCTGTAENEPACTTNYDDVTNGGCDSSPFASDPATCGQTICGKGGWYDVPMITCGVDADCPGVGAGRCAGGMCDNGPFVAADTDWYAITLPGGGGNRLVTFTVDAEFGTAVFITSAPVDCMGTVTAAFGDCDAPAEISACLPPGIHFLAIIPQGFDGVIGCDRDYTATITCGPCPTGACCVAGACTGTTDELSCAGLWVVGETCPAFDCGGLCATAGSGDNCVDACEAVDGENPFDTTAATTDGPAEAGCAFEFGDDQVYFDLWRNYTATCTGTLTIDMCQGGLPGGTSDSDSRVIVYNGAACPPATILGCNDDGAGCAAFSSYLTVPVTMGNPYLIRIGNFDPDVAFASTGSMFLQCDLPVPPPSNDACGGATPLTVGVPVTESNAGATDEAAPDNGACGTPSVPSPNQALWYTVVGNGTTFTAQTCNATGYDTMIQVWCGPCGTLTCVAANDDSSCAASGLRSSVAWCTQAGRTYHLAVGGFGSDAGTHVLTVTGGAACSPPTGACP